MAAVTRVLCAALSLLLLHSGVPAAAQTAPLFLEPSHWSADALRRFGSMGLLPSAADPAMAPLTLRHVRASLEHAAATAARMGRSREAELAQAYLSLLHAQADPSARLVRAWLSAGALAAAGESGAGTGMHPETDWTGAEPLPDFAGPVVIAGLGGHATNRLAGWVTAGYSENRGSVHGAGISAALGPLDVWAGRHRLHYGLGRSGGVVLGAGTGPSTDLSHRIHFTFEGVGVHVREPFDFPGFLRTLGPARIEAVLGRIPESGDVSKPWVAFGRLTGHPFSERITLGVNRGAVFGGNDASLSARNLFGVIIGLHNDDFENQVFSTVVRLRPPLGGLAVEAFVEWGMDDTAGAVKDVPGIVAGVDLGALPGRPEVGLGVEVTHFAGSCCGNPRWFRHWQFRDNWASDGRLFAHPLGGHGTEGLLHVTLDLPRQGLLLRARVLTRKRGEENLFNPGREGRSIGGAASVDYGRGPMRLLLNVAGEDGRGWSAGRVSALLNWSLRPAVR
jgi:hypothetical protein